MTAADDAWMDEALIEAQAAAASGDVPVGCVIINRDGHIIGRAHNERELARDPTAHAEMIAIRQAARSFPSWRLSDTTVYVTLEPCVMCAGALVHARVARVVYGCADPKAGAIDTMFGIGIDETRLNHRFEVTRGIRETECRSSLQRFFSELRRKSMKEGGGV